MNIAAKNFDFRKMTNQTLDSGGKIRYNKVYPNGAGCAVWEIGEGGGNVMTKCKGAVMMGSLSFRGQAVAGAHRSGD